MGVAKYHDYEGQKLTGRQLTRLPECENSASVVYENLKNGESAKEAIKKKIRVRSEPEEFNKSNGFELDRMNLSKVIKPGSKKLTRVQKIIQEEKKKKLQEIFQKPVNPRKCRYTAIAMGLFSEVKKGGFFR